MGPYLAIGCMAEHYRMVAVGVIASIVLIPFTASMSLFGLPVMIGFVADVHNQEA